MLKTFCLSFLYLDDAGIESAGGDGARFIFNLGMDGIMSSSGEEKERKGERDIGMQPIGFVSSDFRDPKELIFACEEGLRMASRSSIVIDPLYADGLKGITEFSHVFVLFHLDRAERVEIETHPGLPGQKGIPRVGVFASRSQYRPNHIALRLVKVVGVEGNVLKVEGLDAIDGSKVLDIKPYVKGFDRPDEFRSAPWYDWVWGPD